jgi:hypothetical protein
LASSVWDWVMWWIVDCGLDRTSTRFTNGKITQTRITDPGQNELS